MKRLTILMLAVMLCLSVQADFLADIVSGKYKAQTLPAFTHLNDGEHYALQEGNLVLKYDYRTGAVTDTLINLETCKAKKGETLPELDEIDGFLLAPNEQYILVYQHKEQVFRRSYTAEYYLYNCEKRTLTRFTEGKIRDIVFSPNSKYVAFTRDRNIFIYKADFGTEVAVTTDGKANAITNGATDWLYEEEFSTTAQMAFSPDSKHLAFLRLDEREVPEFVWQDQLHSQTLHSIKYTRAGQSIAKPSVVTYDIQTKALKTIQLPEVVERYIPRIHWTNNPEELAVFTLNRPQNCLEMYYANPKTALSKRIYREENKTGWVDYRQIDEWQFLESGEILVVNETSGYKQCYLYTHLGQQKKALTNTDFDITAVYGYDEKAQMLYYQSAKDPKTRYIYAANIKKGKTDCIAAEEGTHQATFSKTYKYFIDNYSSLSVANEYNLKTNMGKQVRNLLSNNDLTQEFAALGLPQKRFFEFETERGDKLNAWILYPQNFDEKKQYPVLQVQYSGPESQEVLNRWRIDWEYYWSTQDVIVVCVDPRGTACRGRSFKELTYCKLGQYEAQDQVSLARYMQQKPFVQADKIAIWGWSYGGFMTLRAMAEDSIFACGIAVAPVTDWNLYDAAYTERFMRTPGMNEIGYNAAIMADMAERLEGKLLIVHGLADDNVHCQQTWQYIDALIEAGKQFEMQIYPDDNHFLRKRSNYQHLYNRMRIFLEQYLK